MCKYAAAWTTVKSALITHSEHSPPVLWAHGTAAAQPCKNTLKSPFVSSQTNHLSLTDRCCMVLIYNNRRHRCVTRWRGAGWYEPLRLFPTQGSTWKPMDLPMAWLSDTNTWRCYLLAWQRRLYGNLQAHYIPRPTSRARSQKKNHPLSWFHHLEGGNSEIMKIQLRKKTESTTAALKSHRKFQISLLKLNHLCKPLQLPTSQCNYWKEPVRSASLHLTDSP